MTATSRSKPGLLRVFGLLWRFYSRIPGRAAAVVAMQVLGGLLENVSILGMLPAIQIAMEKQSGEGTSQLSRWIDEAFAAVGVQPSLSIVLGMVLAAVLAKVGLAMTAGAANSADVLGMVQGLRHDIVRQLLHVRWSHFVQASTGRYVNLLGTETERISPALNQGLGLVTDTIHAIFYLTSAVLVSWPITVLAVVLGGVKLVATRPIIAVARRAGALLSQYNATFGAHLVEIIEMAKPIKAMAREDDARNILDEDVREMRQVQWRHQICSLLLTNIDELMIALIMVVCFYLTINVIRADIAQLAVIGVLMSRTISKIGMLQKRYFIAAANETALSGLLETLDRLIAEEDRSHGGIVPVLKDRVAFYGVSVAYKDNVVLADVNLEFPARNLSVIMGPSGSGKTSLIDAMIGLIPLKSGSITIDGVDLDRIDIPAWRRINGYVPQETILLHGSVRDNITLRSSEIADDAIVEALKAAEAWDFVAALSRGLDTFVGERGLMLSGGNASVWRLPAPWFIVRNF